ncbi:restriction modification system DNA specificity domain protein [Pirellula staleyi DSM 6068]|uniref:Restriction modification system DNA specificity domain protein n=1 Tax=Pirellula staleyi (strain ATCC 27377 / DSM 6068 / ICPB 4128) TaxID=530564 RepID=D2R8Y8_PIRSD|nr:restriction endonuclease subunit S [Pirellula staleyi]ADB15815.1 restriction modification system DNA specificity domain protein [Pirellula staleyi DSM 6068]
MAVKPGFKMTEIGEIPAEWNAYHLSQLWKVTDCKHVTATFVPEGYPVASIREVQSKFVNLHAANHTTPHFYRLLIEGGRDPQAGDLILSRNATVGQIAQVSHSHPKFAMGQDVCLLRKTSPTNSTEFIQAVFQSRIIKQQISDILVGSTFKRINVKQIKAFIVPSPSAAEQRAIAGALSDVDALIESLEQLIAKKRAIKQGAMQELLTGKRRLPGFSGKWEKKRLQQIAWYQEGPGVQKHQFASVGTKLLNGSNISHGELFLDQTERYIEDQLANGTYRHFLCDAGDIVIASSGISPATLNEKMAIVQASHLPLCMNTSTIRFKANQDLATQAFLFVCLQGNSFRDQIAGMATGSAQLNFGPSHLNKVELLLPTISEQVAVADVIGSLEHELRKLDDRLTKLRLLKQAMMQQLLTGKIRLV